MRKVITLKKKSSKEKPRSKLAPCRTCGLEFRRFEGGARNCLFCVGKASRWDPDLGFAPNVVTGMYLRVIAERA